MTKKLADQTPEQQERQRSASRAYKSRTVDRRRARHKERYQTDTKYRAYKDAIARRSRLKTTYGITPEQQADMLHQQGDACAICRTKAPGGRGWHTDHDHNTGKVRAMLCTSCNVFLGRIESNPGLLREVTAYIEAHL